MKIEYYIKSKEEINPETYKTIGVCECWINPNFIVSVEGKYLGNKTRTMSYLVTMSNGDHYYITQVSSYIVMSELSLIRLSK